MGDNRYVSIRERVKKCKTKGFTNKFTKEPWTRIP